MPDEEKIDDLKSPEFKSVIPEYLAENMTPSERHIISTLSVMAQKQDWCTDRLVEGHKKIEKCIRRTDRYEKLLVALKSKWAIVVYLGMLIIPIFITRLVNKLFPP